MFLALGCLGNNPPFMQTEVLWPCVQMHVMTNVLSHMNEIHTLPFSKIYFNNRISSPFTPRSVTTDGTLSVVGSYAGFVITFPKAIGHPILPFHCILHQQALWEKDSLCSNFVATDGNSNKVVSLIVALALNNHQFNTFLHGTISQSFGLIMQQNVTWLNRVTYI
jgi:hypothetical protein